MSLEDVHSLMSLGGLDGAAKGGLKYDEFVRYVLAYQVIPCFQHPFFSLLHRANGWERKARERERRERRERGDTED